MQYKLMQEWGENGIPNPYRIEILFLSSSKIRTDRDTRNHIGHIGYVLTKWIFYISCTSCRVYLKLEVWKSLLDLQVVGYVLILYK
jgi:hypothetical protein